MHKIKRTYLTLQDRQIIELEIKKGITYGGISRLIDKSHSCISKEVCKNGGRHQYNAQKAQNDACMLGMSNKKRNVCYVKTLERVEALEMQMEILLDLIKEIKQ